MALQLSTAARNFLLVTGDLTALLSGGVIRIYAGAVPANADAAVTGNTLLCVISNNSAGTGITMSTTAASGVLSKSASEVWSGSVLVNGTATFYRFSPISDAGDLDSTAAIPRLQGSVGTLGADLGFSSALFTIGNTKAVDVYDLAQPNA